MRRSLVLAIAWCCASADAAPAKYGIGRTPTAEELHALDISVAPDGTGLPVGHGSSAEGAVLFKAMCSACHGDRGEGRGDFPVLVGGKGTLGTAQPILTIGSYWPFATTAWDYIHRAMPYSAPGVLAPDQVYALTAFILAANGVISADAVLDEKTLPRVQMPNRNGFVSDPRPDVP